MLMRANEALKKKQRAAAKKRRPDAKHVAGELQANPEFAAMLDRVGCRDIWEAARMGKALPTVSETSDISEPTFGPYKIRQSEIGPVNADSDLLKFLKDHREDAIEILGTTSIKIGKPNAADFSEAVIDDLIEESAPPWSFFEFTLACEELSRPKTPELRDKIRFSSNLGTPLLYEVRDIPRVRYGRLHRLDEVIQYSNLRRLPMRSLFTPVVAEGYERYGILFMLHNTEDPR